MIVAFDIGGTSMKGGLARSIDDIAILPPVPTPAHDLSAFIGVLGRTVVAAPAPVRALALSVAGVIEPETGIGSVANIPCINGIPVQATLEAELGLPVVLANDADCFALAEMAAGAGRGHRIVFGVILGTGVGGGLVVEGRLINATGGFAGEWGHGPVAARIAGTPPVEIPAFPCGCGLAGCLDVTVSARGMVNLHRHLHGRETTSEAVVAGWEAGDTAAARTVAIWLEIAAGPLAMLVNTTAADIIPVGGGLGGSAPLIAALDAAVRPLTLRRFDRTLVVPAQCRLQPGIVGAAWLGLSSGQA